MGHCSLPNSTKNQKLSPLVTDFDENLSAYRADHSERNDTNLSKIRSVVKRYKSLKIGCFCDQSCMKFY